jgi:CelD/BcsL family acetyltransferase involved in cellulose biosynthesis
MMSSVSQGAALVSRSSGADVEITPLAQIDAARDAWAALEPETALSYFQSWAWIGAWLETLPRETRPHLVTWSPGGRLCGAGIVVARARTRSRFIRTRSLFLAQAGVAALDGVTIEHNGFIVRRGLEEEGIAALLEGLVQSRLGWDDLVIGGVDAECVPLYEQAARKAGLACTTSITRPYFTVNLAELRSQKRDYLSTLSSNTRYQVRRAVRAYEELGKLVIAEAHSAEEALAFFRRLGELHQAYWTTRGEPGAFASPYFIRLHETMIRNDFARGAIQLLKVSAGEHEVGYLYNLVHAGVVSSYQSGFNYTDNAHLKPGLVSHHAAIQFNLERGRAIYDFLAGDSQYKRSLCTTTSSMSWLACERPRVRFALERQLRRLLRRPG